MQYNITQAQLGVRPNVEIPSRKVYEELQEIGIRKMVSEHYDLLVQSEIKNLFPSTPELIEIAKNNAADFFVQICGGEPHFSKNRGAPKMGARHAPFEITQNARKVWLQCYKQVIEQQNMSDEAKQSFWNYLDIFSIWMMNSPK